MIEKLVIQKLTIAGKEYEYPDTTALVGKINELADVVNELQKHTDRLSCAILDLATPDGENKALKSIQAEPKTPTENVQDKFAEQRKWIGKLCRFWDLDDGSSYYGPLTKIHDDGNPYNYECNHKICYANCEPVKDDIIYKGGDNE